MMSDYNLMEAIDSEQSRLEEYEELLVRRDQLLKKANSYRISYTAEFGDMLTENFKLKIECIKLKKSISYCRRRLNRGLAIDATKMRMEIEQEMKLYYVQLKEMMKETINAKSAMVVDEYRVMRSKKIYHRLVSILHPDVNKKITENEVLMELWNRIVEAYHRSDADTLDELEVLVHKTMEELGDAGIDLNLSDIEQRIEKVERQINEIITTEPYTYGEILYDEETRKAHREQLQAEHDDYEQYFAALQKALDEILAEGGAVIRSII